MVTTIIVHQNPHHITTPAYYLGGIATYFICNEGMDWSWVWSGLAGCVWPEFWLGYLGHRQGFF